MLSWGAIELAHLTGLSEDQNNEVAAYHGQRVDHRTAAGRVHHRLARCAQRRHRHPGVDGVRAGRARRERDARSSSAPCGWAATTSPAPSTPLVLAYAGSALPLLLLFSVANRSLGDVLTSESVAIEIARSAVGGIALALSVPLTTAIAAVLATPTTSAQPARSFSVSSARGQCGGQRVVAEHRGDVVVHHPESAAPALVEPRRPRPARSASTTTTPSCTNIRPASRCRRPDAAQSRRAACSLGRPHSASPNSMSSLDRAIRVSHVVVSSARHAQARTRNRRSRMWLMNETVRHSERCACRARRPTSRCRRTPRARVRLHCAAA